MLPLVDPPELCAAGRVVEPRFRLKTGSRLAAPLASTIANGTSINRRSWRHNLIWRGPNDHVVINEFVETAIAAKIETQANLVLGHA
jgi:hypothetical protein